MKIKIALAALACSGTLLALLPTSASAAPLSGLSQSHGLTTSDNTLVQKAHRWWRRGWAAPYYGYGYGYGYGYYRRYSPATIGPIIPLTARITTATMRRLRHRRLTITDRTGGLTTRRGPSHKHRRMRRQATAPSSICDEYGSSSATQPLALNLPRDEAPSVASRREP